MQGKSLTGDGSDDSLTHVSCAILLSAGNRGGKVADLLRCLAEVLVVSSLTTSTVSVLSPFGRSSSYSKCNKVELLPFSLFKEAVKRQRLASSLFSCIQLKANHPRFASLYTANVFS